MEHIPITMYLDDGGPDILGRGPQNDKHLLCTLNETYHDDLNDFYPYGITITFSNASLVRKGILIRNKPPMLQFSIIKPYIENTFRGFNYAFWSEWTKKGMIHFHGVVWHDHYETHNSVLLHSMRTLLGRFGKQNNNSNAVAPVSDWDKWIDYCSKEHNWTISNI